MKVEIRYACTYTYAERVTFSPHLYRLVPKVDRHLKVRQFDFRTNAGATTNWRRDLFDNEIAATFYPKPAKILTAKLRLKLELLPKNAFGFLLDTHALHLPFAYKPVELRVLAPYLETAPAPRLPFWPAPLSARPTVPTIVDLNRAIHENLEYERREDGPARLSIDTVRLGRGACRDFAVLMVDVLRGLGLAARHASGYLCEFGEEEEKKAEGALHAWIEVYLPGAGWVGFDPTNGTLCDHHHITAAVGLTPGDISPVVGSYYANHRVPYEMTSSLAIVPHARA